MRDAKTTNKILPCLKRSLIKTLFLCLQKQHKQNNKSIWLFRLVCMPLKYWTSGWVWWSFHRALRLCAYSTSPPSSYDQQAENAAVCSVVVRKKSSPYRLPLSTLCSRVETVACRGVNVRIFTGRRRLKTKQIRSFFGFFFIG